MKLSNLLLFSLFLFVVTILLNALKNVFFPELYGDYLISLTFYMALVFSTVMIWLLPVFIALTRKDLENRFFVLFLSLLLPLVGGFFSYFLIKKYEKGIDKQQYQ
ncbi:hypothetical protein [Vibrio splendidus]|uniref:Uncharacterized protein n=1 Tax=Vibrio splendidus TaxID=29497 RepID=A0A2T5E019_VIBSP|nr:hypothetical protein [Vibrio splendidus]OEE58674.1 hypothetical protein A147_22245 [Vibrio splendidus FF-6]PTP12686.1 hypothetical protein CWO36_23045 [Vibrio splendidus]